jgi:hypothetical protein
MFMSKDGSIEITSLDMFVIVIFHLESNAILIHKLCTSCKTTFVS